MQMDIYYSYACRASYLVFAWLKMVQKSGQAPNIRWRPFAIQMDDPNEYWRQPWATANSELRGFIVAEAARRQGREAFLRFHDALEQAVHEQLLELGDESTLIGAAQQAGLDVNRFQADWHDPQLAQAAQRGHVQAVEQEHVSGTPTLVSPNGRSFHLELSEIPPQADALEVFRAIETLTVTHPYISLFRQTNNGN
ncbi:MAG: DsbA family protein [Anaerolineales bacterium]